MEMILNEPKMFYAEPVYIGNFLYTIILSIGKYNQIVNI